MQVAGQPIGPIGRLQQQRDAFARLVFHAFVVVDVAEDQEAAFLPPQRPLGRSLWAAEALGEVLDRLGRGDDLFQLPRQLLDPGRGWGDTIRHGKFLPRGAPPARAPPRETVSMLARMGAVRTRTSRTGRRPASYLPSGPAGLPTTGESTN